MFFKELSSRNDDTTKPKNILQSSQPNMKSFKKLSKNFPLEKVNKKIFINIIF